MAVVGETDVALGMIVDCSTGHVTHAPLSIEEVEARQQRSVAHAVARQAEADARRQLVAAVVESADPAVLALAKLMGVLPLRDATS